jgi:hypothetical protein
MEAQALVPPKQSFHFIRLKGDMHEHEHRKHG